MFIRLLIASVLVGAAMPLRAAADLGPYGSLPAVENMAISPDGERVAIVRTHGDERQLVIATVEGAKPVAVVTMGEQPVAAVEWADDEHVLVGIRTRELGVGLVPSRGRDGEWTSLAVYDVTANRMFDALAADYTYKTLNLLNGRPRLRRDNGAVHLLLQGVYFEHNQNRPGLFRTPLGGVAQLVARGDEDLESWVVDASDNIIATENYLFTSHHWSLRARHGGRFEEISRSEAEAEEPGVWGVAPTGDALWIYRFEGDARVTRAVSLATGATSEPLAEVGDPQSTLIERYSDRVMGTASHASHYEYHFFDPRVQHAWESVQAAFPDQAIQMLSYSDDFMRWAIRVENPVAGPIFVLADLRKGKVTKFGFAYEGINGVAPVRAFHYKAGDGLEIPAYLTLPRGREAKGLPLVVFAHGGPNGSDHADFSIWSQLLAAQGYAVLQANFRGSGLGWGFVKAGFGQWGRKIQSDLSDGVASLVAEGVIDPKRVCIAGAEFGGYAALAGVTLTQGIYRCAVSLGGISDFRSLREFRYGDARSETTGARYFDRMVGGNGANDMSLDQISPFHHAVDLNVPVLFVHDRHDPAIPYEQSRMMVEALRKAGKKPEFVTFEAKSPKAADFRLMMQSTIDFLRANNPPD
jgi:dipeptidyl aminopeptidase/acylaminoacyl peptidase